MPNKGVWAKVGDKVESYFSSPIMNYSVWFLSKSTWLEGQCGAVGSVSDS